MGSTAFYILVLVLYFIAMLAIGVVFSKRVKTDDEYFIARDKLSAPAIGFSFSATQMSGSSYMGTVGSVRSLGYCFIPAAISSAAAPWFCYVLVGDRIRRISARLRAVTMSDVFGARFGKKVGILSAIIIMICSVPTVAAQLKAAGTAFEVLIGIPYVAALFVFGGIVILYTLLGGMFAVAWTDLIQGILMILGFAILTPIVLSASGGFTQMHVQYAAFNPNGITLNGGQSLMWIISGFLVWGFFQVGGQPASITRFQTTSDTGKLKRVLLYSIVFESIIYIGLTIISIAAGVLIPTLENSDMALPILIQQYLHPVIGGIVLAAALGAMMSTVDSVLLMVSSVFVENVYRKLSSKDVDNKKSLFLGRIITIIVGVLGLLIAIDPPDAVLWIITMGFSVMAAAFTFPLLLGLWSKRTTEAGGMAGIIGGAVMAIFWYVLGYVKYRSLSAWVGGIWPAIIGALVSVVLTLAVSSFTKPISQETEELFFDDAE